jgi:hypothetical protein
VTLHLVPVSQLVAKDCVSRWHRHNAAPRGDLFRVGAATEDRPDAKYEPTQRTLWEAPCTS